MAAVSDTSPLILLAKTGYLDLLRAVFPEVLMPGAVSDEIRRGHAADADVERIEAAEWIRIQLVRRESVPPDLPAGLGAGEREAIALIIELGPGTTLIVDDRPARRATAALDLPHVGTAGILLNAKDRGAISEIRTPLDTLRAAGLYLSEQQYRRALSLAGE